MYGLGILKGLEVTLKHLVVTFVDDIKWLGRKNNLEVFQQKQSLANKGLVTVQYPEEKLAMPERFRFIPFLVVYNHDDPEYPNKDWCTSCGICAKVCPPQCIWIVRGTDPKTGRPKPEPEQFYIDIDICMNCGYCSEYCPFDAIKMDHDYELSSYDRTSYHIFDHEKLSKEISYWQAIAPTTAAEEEKARGGYDQSDTQKARKKAGLPASRPGPVADRPSPAPVAAVPVAAAPTAAPVANAAAPAPVAAAPAPAATTGAATTADGKPIVRRRGAAPKKEGGAEGAATAEVVHAAPTAAAPVPAAPIATAPVAAPVVPAATAAAPDAPPASGDAPGGMVQRGKRLIDPNAPPPVVRRRNPPSK